MGSQPAARTTALSNPVMWTFQPAPFGAQPR